MSNDHAIRITRPFSDISGTIRVWADRSHAVVAYEHPADEEVAQTHVHIAIYGCEVKAEALKRMFLGEPGTGNGFWSFKKLDSEYLSDLQRTEDISGHIEFIKYMSKGTLQPKFVKNISQQVLERCRLAWVPPDNIPESEIVIRSVVAAVRKDWDDQTVSRHEQGLPALEFSLNALLGKVRSTTFHKMYFRHRMFPHGSQYRIVAGSAFLRLCEHYGKFQEGSEIISQLWL